MIFWKTVFYGFWTIYLFTELYAMFDPAKNLKLHNSLRRKTEDGESGKKTSLKWDELDPEQKKGVKNILLIAGPALLLRFVGLFSINWLIFLIWILVSLFLSTLTKEMLHRYRNVQHVLRFYVSMTSGINAVFALTVILNSYHFFIDNTELVKSLLK